MPSTPGPAVDLIEYAAGVIVAKQREPHTAPYHWAGALYEAGMLVAPGTALTNLDRLDSPRSNACPRCGSTRPIGRYEVCAPCAAAEGWDPHCPACTEEGRGLTATTPHVTTCAGGAA